MPLCSLLQVVSKYNDELMLMIHDEFGEAWVNCDPQKCLNTGILLSTLFLGKTSSSKIVQRCENDAVTRQIPHETRKRANTFFSRLNNPGLFYVILSDGNFSLPRDRRDNLYFPGHIFILECGIDGTITMMQTFVNEYDLRSPKSCTRLDDTTNIVTVIDHLYFGRNWSSKTTIAFKKLTGVDCSAYEGRTTHESQFNFVAVPDVSLSRAKSKIQSTVRKWRQRVLENTLKNDWVCGQIAIPRRVLLRRLHALMKKLASQ